MQFLRTLFWVVLAAIAAVFATRNWINVPVSLWGGLTADIKLPVLVLLAFLLGLLPTLAIQRTRYWRLQRRLAEAERIAEQPREAAPPAPSAPVIRSAPEPIVPTAPGAVP